MSAASADIIFFPRTLSAAYCVTVVFFSLVLVWFAAVVGFFFLIIIIMIIIFLRFKCLNYNTEA
jgi:hypothetical protein